MTTALSTLAALVTRHSGIVLTDAHMPALRSALGRVRPGLEAQGMLELLGDPERGPLALDQLLDELTVNETYFMRHTDELADIPWRRLLDGARRAGASGVRVWSAACATGEEAYSLAVLGLEALPEELAPLTVLGSDLSVAALRHARAGHYGVRSTRSLEPGVRQRHFEADDAGLSVAPAVRGLVRFLQHNLVADPLPPTGEGPFELVVCRNVLIYFRPETARSVVARLRGALAPDGLLIVGAADRLALSPLHDRRPPVPPARRRPPAAGRGGRTASTPVPRDQSALETPPPADALEQALLAADSGDLAGALEAVERVLTHDGLDATAHGIRGLVQRAAGEPRAAVVSLRRALYLDPTFVRAAFELGQAHDALGDRVAAQRAYRHTLSALGAAPEEGHRLLGVTAPADLAQACRRHLSPPPREALA